METNTRKKRLRRTLKRSGTEPNGPQNELSSFELWCMHFMHPSDGNDEGNDSNERLYMPMTSIDMEFITAKRSLFLYCLVQCSILKFQITSCSRALISN